MPAALPPTVTSEPLGRTARSRSWLWPALALVVVLATAVVLGRSGDSREPSPNRVALAAPTTDLSLSPPPESPPPVPPTATRFAVPVDPIVQPAQPTAGPIVISPLSGRPFVAERWNGQRFVDGIPTSIDHQQVLRVGSALLAAVGSSVLVGGWYDTPFITDDPAATARSATLRVDGPGGPPIDGEGPRILSGTLYAGSCSGQGTAVCAPYLFADGYVWSGDQETSAGPIATLPLMHELSAQFPTLDFKPFLEQTTCPVNWPDQTYMTSSATVPRAEPAALGVRMVILFPTIADRRAREQQLRRSSESLPGFEATARCVSLPGGVLDGDWYSFDNVMLLLAGGDPDVVARAREALLASEAAAGLPGTF